MKTATAATVKPPATATMKTAASATAMSATTMLSERGRGNASDCQSDA